MQQPVAKCKRPVRRPVDREYIGGVAAVDTSFSFQLLNTASAFVDAIASVFIFRFLALMANLLQNVATKIPAEAII